MSEEVIKLAKIINDAYFGCNGIRCCSCPYFDEKIDCGKIQLAAYLTKLGYKKEE